MYVTRRVFKSIRNKESNVNDGHKATQVDNLKRSMIWIQEYALTIGVLASGTSIAVGIGAYVLELKNDIRHEQKMRENDIRHEEEMRENDIRHEKEMREIDVRRAENDILKLLVPYLFAAEYEKPRESLLNKIANNQNAINGETKK